MKKVLIIGNGLMGGSLGMALTNTGKYIVSFYDKNPKLSTINIQHHFAEKMQTELAKAQVILNTQKFHNYTEYFENREIINSFDVIFDATGSNIPSVFNQPTINIASIQYHSEPLFEDMTDTFIFCHPLCGSEKSGRENARADLFKNQNCIITTEGKSQELIDFATDIFKEIGMNVFYCDTAEEHNKNLAYTSHLLHYLALNGFADLHPVLKRLSYSNKEMWDGIFEVNKKNIDKAMLEFCYNLSLCFHNQGIVASIRELVTDIPQHFYGTALKQLLNKN